MGQANLNWGLIGDGFIAHRFAQNMKDNQVPLQAVLARNFAKAQQFAHEYGIKKTYRTAAAFFADSKIQAVYIATPNSAHASYIKQELKAGKHVLCEKPMVVNAKQFKQLAALAEQKHLLLEEAYTPLHMPVMKTIRTAIAKNKIGPVRFIAANFCEKADLSDPRSRLLNPALGGGNLLDMGCYPLCFALMFLHDQPLRVQSQVKMGPTGVDLASSILLSNDQQQAQLSSSFLSLLPKDALISGSKGYILVKHFSRSDQAEIFYAKGGHEQLQAGDSDQAWTYEARDLARYVRQGHDDGQLALSRKIIGLMDRLRQKWQLHYPFE